MTPHKQQEGGSEPYYAQKKLVSNNSLYIHEDRNYAQKSCQRENMNAIGRDAGLDMSDRQIARPLRSAISDSG
jgi:tRNA U34 2-thiouridine synthase MnmA/TrmU